MSTEEVNVGKTWSEFVVPLIIVQRAEWGALRPTKRRRLEIPVENLLISHTQSEHCNNKEDCMLLMRQMQMEHMEQGEPDIRYNFVVGGDGLIYEGRGWEFCPWKHPNYPTISGCSIEISHAGKIGSKTNSTEVSSRYQLITYGEQEGYISTYPEVKYHFDSLK